MADNQGLKPIYIEQLFRSKNPGVAKMIPGFIYSYLKKVIHQDDINDFITRYGDRKGLDFSDAILEYLHVSYQVIGEANSAFPRRPVYFCVQSSSGWTRWYYFNLFFRYTLPGIEISGKRSFIKPKESEQHFLTGQQAWCPSERRRFCIGRRLCFRLSDDHVSGRSGQP